MSSKTPVSGLQEYVVRFNFGSMPKYDLLQMAGPSHNPIFHVKVTVGDEFATGCGRSKQEAKHAAAKLMYDGLRSMNPTAGSFKELCPAGHDDTTEPNMATENNFGTPHIVPGPIQSETVDPGELPITGNPIGELQELCVSRYWPLPAYQIELENGLPHRKLFSVSCRVSNIEEVGTGQSKKLAKRTAAFKMLLRVRKQSNVDSTPTRAPNGFCGEKFPSPERMALAKVKDDQERRNSDQRAGYDDFTELHQVALGTTCQPAAYEAYLPIHSVSNAMANLRLNQSKREVNLNITVNLNVNGTPTETITLANPTKAVHATGTRTAQPATPSTALTSTPTPPWDSEDYKRCSANRCEVSFGDFDHDSIFQRVREDPFSGGPSSQAPKYSGYIIDRNDADYIEGGVEFGAVGEARRKLGMTRGVDRELRGATASSGSNIVPNAITYKSAMSPIGSDDDSLFQLACEDPFSGCFSSGAPKYSGNIIDPNDADYIEGGGRHATIGEGLRELRMKRDAERKLRTGNRGATASNASNTVMNAITYMSATNPTSDPSMTWSDRVMTNDTSDMKPSQRTSNNCEERWLYCLSKTYGGEDVDTLKGGKWMIFARNCCVDEVWSKLKTAVESGEIWQAKVSWLDPMKKSHAIMVFTLDYEDVDDVIRVLDVLEEIGVKQESSQIYYKTNYLTLTSAGVYSGGKEKPWIYSSSDIRERAKTVKYNYY